MHTAFAETSYDDEYASRPNDNNILLFKARCKNQIRTTDGIRFRLKSIVAQP